ncbi:MAG: hypothetical protein WC656_03295 [Sulfurimonas sp.]|jgi:hypothetical protein
MALGSIGQNGAEEFFDTLIHQTAFTEAQSQIHAFTKDVDSEVLKDAIESSMSVIATGLLFLMMRQQENFIAWVFLKVQTKVALILGSDIILNKAKRLAGKRGVKLFKKLGFMKSNASDRIALSNVVVGQGHTQMTGEQTAHSTHDNFQASMSMKEHMVNKEKLHMDVGNAMASRYNDTLMFKLFTKSFTANDELMIKKILGRDTASALDIADINKVADFMFVTDSNGKTTGLTEQFYTLLNGMGYLHK